MRAFHLAYGDILQTPSARSAQATLDAASPKRSLGKGNFADTVCKISNHCNQWGL